jgi:hypothetical protein
MKNGPDTSRQASTEPPPRHPLILREPRVEAATLRAAVLAPGDDVSEIRVERALVAGALDLAGVAVSIPLAFHDCEFDSALSAKDAHVKSLELSACKLMSLDADGLVSPGGLDMRDTVFKTGLRLDRAELGGADALVADRVRVAEDVTCHGLSATGRVRFTSAQIGATLDLGSANLRHGVDLREVRADTIVLPQHASQGVDLSGAEVRLLRDHGELGRLTLRNFTFRELEPLEGAESRLAWLEYARGVDMESYRHLATALQTVGSDAEADWVIARGRRLTYRGAPDRLGESDLLRVPSDQRAARESVAGLLPSVIVLVGLSAVVYGAFEVLPRLDHLQPGATTTWNDVIGWLGLILLVLTAVFALLPLIRGLLIRVSPWRRRLRPPPRWMRDFRIPAVVLSGAADRIDRRYGLDARYGWPRLAALLPDDARKVVEDTQRQLDIFVAAPPGFIGAAVVTAVFAPYFHVIPALAIAPVSMLVLALVTITRAGAAAADHGRAVEAAVDLHRFRLLDALHIPLPEDPARERELFERVSLSFVRAEPYAGAYLHPSQAVAGLEEVGRTLEDMLAEKISEAIEGPPLVNFNGHVSVRVLQAGNDMPLAFDDDQVVLVPGQEYVIEVTIGPDAIPKSRSGRIVIINGIRAEQVPFDVSLDADTLELSTPERPVIVPETGARSETFGVRLRPGEADQSVWVRVSQRGRLSQLVALRLSPRGIPK